MQRMITSRKKITRPLFLLGIPVSIVALCFICMLAMPAAAQDKLPRLQTDGSSGLTFALENDLFADRDDGYTNGIRIGYIAPRR
jgi:lipopolysaccharide export LptBFGC system permease protein LptF